MSLVGGYSLNYYHWLTELLPGLLRLLPALREDPALRVLTHAGVPWSRSLLVDVLGIPAVQLLEDRGCSLYRAEVLYSWSLSDPLS